MAGYFENKSASNFEADPKPLVFLFYREVDTV